MKNVLILLIVIILLAICGILIMYNSNNNVTNTSRYDYSNEANYDNNNNNSIVVSTLDEEQKNNEIEINKEETDSTTNLSEEIVESGETINNVENITTEDEEENRWEWEYKNAEKLEIDTSHYKEAKDIDFEFLKLEQEKDKNMIYSPLSIKTALLMLRDGATGNTKTQIDKLIGDYEGKSYSSSKNISFANSVFIRDSFKQYVLDSYGENLKAKFGAEVFIDPFESAKNANDWIEKKTLGLIKDMLKDDAVSNPATVMLLINALGIDMKWNYQYDPQYDTYYSPDSYFSKYNIKLNTNSAGIVDWKDVEKYHVPMMDRNFGVNTYGKDSKFFDWYTEGYHTQKDIEFFVSDDLTVLAKNLREYDGIKLQFVAIQPEETPLSDFVSAFDAKKYNDIISNLKHINKEDLPKNKIVTVETRLPKFKFDYDLKLKDDLIKLGIKDAFSMDNAKFYNIIDESSDAWLYVSDALHKANIDLSEEGIKAAAVTVLEEARRRRRRRS